MVYREYQCRTRAIIIRIYVEITKQYYRYRVVEDLAGRVVQHDILIMEIRTKFISREKRPDDVKLASMYRRADTYICAKKI